MSTTTRPLDGPELLHNGAEALKRLLGTRWVVKASIESHDHLGRDRDCDAVWEVAPPAGGPAATVLVEAKLRPTPAIAEASARQLAHRAEERHAVPLFLAPWLSPRARQVLDSIPVGYLDLTGNVHLSLEAPAVLIRTVGDDRDPAPASQAKRGLSGALAGRLVRELVDHDAPRQPRELTRAAGISESYTSRLLDVMTREALITRNNKEITHIDWEGLLRARAATYDLTGVNSVVPTIARQGVDEVLRKLQRGASRHEVLVTGTYAATVLAPLAVGGALMLYVRASPLIEDVRKDLALMRAREVNDADVLLLVSPDSAVFIRPEASLFNGLLGVGISQLALDCLSGPGRMPAEAEELLAWMRGNEHAWRRPSPRQTP